MITRQALGAILLLLPLGTAVSAQEGSVRYDHSKQVVLTAAQEEAFAARGRAFEARGGRQGEGARSARGGRPGQSGRGGSPPGTAATVILAFTTVESLMRIEPPDEEEAETPATDNRRGFARDRRGGATRAANEVIIATYADNEANTLTEIREFMGRTFRISAPKPTYEWRLVAEQSEFLGYMVQKATASPDSTTTIEAWFTPQIPVSAGPGPYGGLPGMILVVSVNRGEELYSAIEVDLGGIEEDALAAPDEGDEITREEYELLVEEKLQEMRDMFRRRIR